MCPVLGRSDRYGGSDYRLKSGCWHTHRLLVCEVRPVHYVVLSGDVLWLTVLQLEQAGYVVHGVLSNFFFKFWLYRATNLGLAVWRQV
jgi:hypothetical protein